MCPVIVWGLFLCCKIAFLTCMFEIRLQQLLRFFLPGCCRKLTSRDWITLLLLLRPHGGRSSPNLLIHPRLNLPLETVLLRWRYPTLGTTLNISHAPETEKLHTFATNQSRDTQKILYRRMLADIANINRTLNSSLYSSYLRNFPKLRVSVQYQNIFGSRLKYIFTVNILHRMRLNAGNLSKLS